MGDTGERQSRRGSAARVLATALLAALLAGGCARPEAEPTPDGDARAVLPGTDVLFRDSLHLVRGRRVGLITNPTGVDAAGRSTIDRLHDHPEVRLVTLFAPEHGLRAGEGEGVTIADEVDPRTGLPVVSLYQGAKRAPTPDDLAGIDVVVFDIQDIGARYYTYVYTMALSMEAAGAAGIPFVVLDRPNPLGRTLQGNLLDPAFRSFVGRYPLPMRHGMTAGELARFFRGEFGVEVDLRVVPVEGWSGAGGFATTGLPWIGPSPNIPDLASARLYPGLCLFEGTNLSVGRGTPHPFQQVGAPWLDGELLAERMEARGLPGVRFEGVRFTPESPTDGKWDGIEVSGVRVVEADGARHDPTRTAVVLLAEARALAGDQWRWDAAHFDRLAGTDALRRGLEEGDDPTALVAGWAPDLAAFAARAAPYLVYPAPFRP